MAGEALTAELVRVFYRYRDDLMIKTVVMRLLSHREMTRQIVQATVFASHLTDSELTTE